jgi:hypothetical protein
LKTRSLEPACDLFGSFGPGVTIPPDPLSW